MSRPYSPFLSSLGGLERSTSHTLPQDYSLESKRRPTEQTFVSGPYSTGARTAWRSAQVPMPQVPTGAWRRFPTGVIAVQQWRILYNHRDICCRCYHRCLQVEVCYVRKSGKKLLNCNQLPVTKYGLNTASRLNICWHKTTKFYCPPLTWNLRSSFLVNKSCITIQRAHQTANIILQFPHCNWCSVTRVYTLRKT